MSVTPYELFCRIDVADTGIGLAEEECGRVFQRFYRSPAVRGEQGVGLGLYLARSVAQAYGGKLVLANTGTGAQAQLCLPMQ